MLALDTALACAFRNLSGLASFIHGRLKPRFKPGWAKPQKPTLAEQNYLFDTVMLVLIIINIVIIIY